MAAHSLLQHVFLRLDWTVWARLYRIICVPPSASSCPCKVQNVIHFISGRGLRHDRAFEKRGDDVFGWSMLFSSSKVESSLILVWGENHLYWSVLVRRDECRHDVFQFKGYIVLEMIYLFLFGLTSTRLRPFWSCTSLIVLIPRDVYYFVLESTIFWNCAHLLWSVNKRHKDTEGSEQEKRTSNCSTDNKQDVGVYWRSFTQYFLLS